MPENIFKRARDWLALKLLGYVLEGSEDPYVVEEIELGGAGGQAAPITCSEKGPNLILKTQEIGDGTEKSSNSEPEPNATKKGKSSE